MRSFIRTALFANSLISTLLLLGCSQEDDRLPCIAVRGSVTVDGLPAKGIVLQLRPTESTLLAQEGIFPGAVTGPDGKFEVMTYEAGDGAPQGEYAIILFWPPDFDDPLATSGNQSGDSVQSIPAGPPDRFGGKYFDPRKTKWSVVVKETEIEIPVIQL